MNTTATRARAVDILLGGAFAALGAQQTVTTARHSTPLAAVVVVVAGLAIAALITMRRRLPVPVLLLTAVCTDVVTLLTNRPGPTALPVAVAVYTVAVRTGPVSTTLAALTGWVLICAVVPAAHFVHAPAITAGPVLLQALVLLGAAALIGLYTAERRRSAQAAADDAARARREQDLLARQAALAERVWLASELHDVVGHHVSLLVVQAGAVRTALPETHPTRPILDSMISGGREAMAEMRRLVDVLRPTDDSTAPDDRYGPHPGVPQIPHLCERLHASGLPVQCELVGDLDTVPATVSRTAYRVVQEALTNVVKHAGTVPTQVRVARDGTRLDLRITNAAASRAADVLSSEHSGGHGLTGMRARVELFGGRLLATPVPGGGWAVHATVNLDEATDRGQP